MDDIGRTEVVMGDMELRLIELEEAGLAVPFYRQVCEELADRGFPIQRDLLTLEETKEAILEGLKGLRGK